MDLRWRFSSIFLRTLFLTTIDIVHGSSTNNILLNDLKHFDMNRHHKINPYGKQLAQDYIKNTLTSLGLHTWTEQFKAPGTPWNGTNIVGVLPGRQYKKRYDRLILIGAHYDTVRTTKGVDDNGSGVVAMLQVARILSKDSSEFNISQGRCTREYSVMFVAFDFEEWENSSLPGWACDKLGCGSRAFMANFSQYWNSSPDMFFAPYGQLQGAIIMDTMMNYDSTPNSQIVPLQLKTIFPKQYKSIIGNKKG
ncbi:uncharacterized protein LOC116287729 [Actinia tenebrosa]|uniref:Uncharacterized protein LOC116287729 n=1 Tax=Actinia tenebrosa TaxID=6105 RepID=A0A6P8H4C4_ACTTE|nr:uncharacterized protein LOC116287729 [Actinia tenebrosa]